MRPKSPRVAVRAVIVEDGRLLMVNAWPDGQSPLMCAPGGGVEVGSSLPDNLAREVQEETGLHVSVGAPCLINEFHDPASGYHQIDLFFRCTILPDSPRPTDWTDTEHIVTDRRWLTLDELEAIPHKPDSLGAAAFGTEGVSYDPLEVLVK
ncbi:NUDIX domain-containing protein [Tateyamaria pelophila]|uniref:NUDIX domain-containing protein n=1 Tax=Tateyamaria pelophila TaxID=328415 RepID=UPI001CC11E06|nr:NUDIX domain-containing protein [Tateyamaria pelophila]